MELHWNWLCLSVILLNFVAADVEEDHAEVEYKDHAEVEYKDHAEVEYKDHAEVEYKDHAEVEYKEDVEEIDAGPLFQVAYTTPQPTGEVYFFETFDDGTLNGWVLSRTQKEDTDDDIAKYDGRWEVEELKLNRIPGDRGLVLKSSAKHHAIAAMLNKPFIFDDQPLIVQYEVNFQGGIDCGGAYIKLLSNSEDLDLEQFFDKTPYTIMFGPDKCGEDYKLHFIFRHKNPKTGDYEEKHAKRPETDLKTYFTDMKTHLYTLVLKPDDTYEMLIDQTHVSQGSLLEDMIPPVNPPKEIDDPHDEKPEEWDERLKIPDPSAVKPDDWDEDEPATIADPNAVKPEGWLDDEPAYIPEPNAEKPEDWDEETNGEWEAAHILNPKCESAPGCGIWSPPTITNPHYKGKWTPPQKENPNYQGIWNPEKIPNPYYFEELHPFTMTSFSAIGLELWSMTTDIYFDNFIICSEKEVADRWASDSWGIKKLVANANEPGVLSQLLSAAEESPWLWIIYFLTAGVPALLLAFLFWPRKKTDEDVLCQSIDEPQTTTKGELEGVEEEEEEMQEEEDNLRCKKENEVEGGKETSEKEFEDEQICDGKNEAGEDSQEGEDDGNRSDASASGEEIKHADENSVSGDGSVRSVRKRRLRKD